eukprot:g46475.t1
MVALCPAISLPRTTSATASLSQHGLSGLASLREAFAQALQSGDAKDVLSRGKAYLAVLRIHAQTPSSSPRSASPSSPAAAVSQTPSPVAAGHSSDHSSPAQKPAVSNSSHNSPAQQPAVSSSSSSPPPSSSSVTAVGKTSPASHNSPAASSSSPPDAATPTRPSASFASGVFAFKWLPLLRTHRQAASSDEIGLVSFGTLQEEMGYVLLSLGCACYITAQAALAQAPKDTMKHLRTAAGYFRWVGLICQNDSAGAHGKAGGSSLYIHFDINPITANALESMCLVNAQEIMIKSGEEGGKTSAKLLSKLAQGIAERCSAIRMELGKGLGNTFHSIQPAWNLYLKAKAEAYPSLALLHQAKVYEEGSEHGKRIACLRHSVATLQLLQPNLLQACSKEVGLMRARVEKACQEAERDNEKVYFMLVPKLKELPALEGSLVVTPLEVELGFVSGYASRGRAVTFTQQSSAFEFHSLSSRGRGVRLLRNIHQHLVLSFPFLWRSSCDIHIVTFLSFYDHSISSSVRAVRLLHNIPQQFLCRFFLVDYPFQIFVWCHYRLSVFRSFMIPSSCHCGFHGKVFHENQSGPDQRDSHETCMQLELQSEQLELRSEAISQIHNEGRTVGSAQYVALKKKPWLHCYRNKWEAKEGLRIQPPYNPEDLGFASTLGAKSELGYIRVVFYIARVPGAS